MNFLKAIQNYLHAPISRHLLLELLKDYKRPNDKISELIKKGELIALKRGLYVPGTGLGLPIPEPFMIANHLRGPSYVTLESALSYWDLIPERVVEIISATTKTSKKYITPVGRFSYHHLPIPYYSLGVKNIELSEKQHILIASPEKAVCDKIILTAGINMRSQKQAWSFLTEDLRIDDEAISQLDGQQIQKWIEYAPKKTSLQQLVQLIKSL